MSVDEFVGLEARLWSQQHRQESSQVTTVSKIEMARSRDRAPEATSPCRCAAAFHSPDFSAANRE